jgi:hypothetical protein
MEMTWMEVAPSSERVIEDVNRMLVVLEKIIAAGGCVVPGEFLRTGRRAVRADGTKALGSKARKCQRIETLPGEFFSDGAAGGARGRHKGPGQQGPQVPADRNPGGPAPPP